MKKLKKAKKDFVKIFLFFSIFIFLFCNVASDISWAKGGTSGGSRSSPSHSSPPAPKISTHVNKSAPHQQQTIPKSSQNVNINQCRKPIKPLQSGQIFYQPGPDALKNANSTPSTLIKPSTQSNHTITTNGVSLSRDTNPSANNNGVVYLRTSKDGEQYVGQSKNLERYQTRQAEHIRKDSDADYNFRIIGRAKEGKDLDILEQKKINEYGGLQKNGGTLQNKKNQISQNQWERNGIKPPDKERNDKNNNNRPNGGATGSWGSGSTNQQNTGKDRVVSPKNNPLLFFLPLPMAPALEPMPGFMPAPVFGY